ncbi:MAG: flagellar motor switch phosphatase FliY [Clostridiales bacterium]|nr:flagellar motor switch phosphatase FliY [Clostridiales bacterium]
MENEIFSPMAIDALGEMMNISLGSSATAVSNMLDHRVDITTPKVSVVNVNEFTLGNLEPAMGIEIKYVSGLEGSNIMLLKKSDIKVIVDILMGSETPEEEFELNDLTISAVCEVMNQMMGAASTALSDFLGYAVNISTPKPFELDVLENFKEEYLPQGAETIVVVRFSLKIEDALESEFMNVMSVELAKELIVGLGLGEGDDTGSAQPQAAAAPAAEPPAADASGGKQLSQAEIEQLMQGNAAPAPSAPAPAAAPAAPAAAVAAQQPAMPPMPQPAGEAPGANMQAGYPPYYPPYPYPYPYPPQDAPRAEPKVINAHPLEMQQMALDPRLAEEQAQNLDLIMEVPLQIAVEIGRTKRKVEDILTLAKGSLVVLDKLAGDQVDVFANGKCIAKGDVVVVDDNFGVRITEIM